MRGTHDITDYREKKTSGNEVLPDAMCPNLERCGVQPGSFYSSTAAAALKSFWNLLSFAVLLSSLSSREYASWSKPFFSR